MKVLAISAASALVLGLCAGAFATPPKLAAPEAAEGMSVVSGEDPGMRLYAVAMGGESRAAPQPYVPVAYPQVATNDAFVDQVQGELAALERQVQDQAEAARARYLDLFSTPYDTQTGMSVSPTPLQDAVITPAPVQVSLDAPAPQVAPPPVTLAALTAQP